MNTTALVSLSLAFSLSLSTGGKYIIITLITTNTGGQGAVGCSPLCNINQYFFSIFFHIWTSECLSDKELAACNSTARIHIHTLHIAHMCKYNPAVQRRGALHRGLSQPLRTGDPEQTYRLAATTFPNIHETYWTKWKSKHTQKRHGPLNRKPTRVHNVLVCFRPNDT